MAAQTQRIVCCQVAVLLLVCSGGASPKSGSRHVLSH